MATNAQKRESYAAGATAPAGVYRCVCCGYVLRHTATDKLRPCPADDGLHAIKAWHPVEAMHDGDAKPAGGPMKPR